MPASPVPPGGATSFTVQFASVSAAAKTAALHIANNMPGSHPYDLTLAAQPVVALATQDADGDGLNDVAEIQLAGLGFNWQVSQPALVNTYYSNASAAGLYNQAQYDANLQAGISAVTNAPNTYNLYTLSQVQALNVGTPLLTKNPGTWQFKLTIRVQKSTNLFDFSPFPMTAPQTLINGQGELEFQFTVPDNAAFFRLESH